MGTKLESLGGSGIIKPEFTELLNEKNMDLWKELNQLYAIELEESQEGGYMTYFGSHSVIIEIDMQDLTPASLTHELLHVYMKSMGVEITWDLKKKILEDRELMEIFSTSLRVHIGNCLEHVKMLPLFLSRGFRQEDFISDYNQRFFDEERMQELEQTYYKNGKPVLEKVDIFIDKFFTMNASNNPAFDYAPYLKRLEKLDYFLYTIHRSFWKSWERFEVGQAKQFYLQSLDTYLRGVKNRKEL